MTATESETSAEGPPVVVPRVDFGAYAAAVEGGTGGGASVGVGVGGGACSAADSARAAAAAAWDGACREHGFAAAQLPLGALDAALLRRAFDAAEALFGLPDAHKATALARNAGSANVGYSPRASEALDRAGGRACDKECFNVRVTGNDFAGCPEGFEEVAMELLGAMKGAAVALARAAADALGLPAGDGDFFCRALRAFDLCTLRFVHYPPTSMPEGECHALRCGAHTDFGMLTILAVRDFRSGLQATPVDGGEASDAAGAAAQRLPWRDVHVAGGDRDCVVINTGAMLARWTNDVWRATAHRVVARGAEELGASRYSIAFFVDPDADTQVATHPALLRGAGPRDEAISALSFLTAKIEEMQRGAARSPA